MSAAMLGFLLGCLVASATEQPPPEETQEWVRVGYRASRTAAVAFVGGAVGFPLVFAVELPVMVPVTVFCLARSAQGMEGPGGNVASGVLLVGLGVGAAWQLSGSPLLAWSSLRQREALAARGVEISGKPGALAWKLWGASLVAAGGGVLAWSLRETNPLRGDNGAEEWAVFAGFTAVGFHYASLGAGGYQSWLAQKARKGGRFAALPAPMIVPWTDGRAWGVGVGFQ